MTSYLLLRNNKESGPYSLNDLVSLGLKPYDLVWVKGKSAAWRYPGEIPELQEFAPAVEEQPFDRFYKKTEGKVQDTSNKASAFAEVSADKQEDTIEKVQETRQKESTFAEATADKREEVKKEAYVPKKSVFVTMPGQKQQQYQQPAAKQETAASTAAAASQSQYAKYQPLAEEEVKPLTKTITITENPVTAEIKYSQPLDEIKEMYVKTLQQRKQRMANKTMIMQSAKKIAVILAIVAAGVLIGFTLKSNKMKNEMAVSGNTNTSAPANNLSQQTQSNLTDQSKTEQDPLLEGLPKQGQDEAIQYNQQDEQPEQPADKNNDEPASRKQAATSKQQESHEQVNSVPEKTTVPSNSSEQTAKRKEPVIDEPSPSVDVNERTGERSRKMRNGDETMGEPVTKQQQAEQPKAVMKGSGTLSKLVSVSSNNYQRVAFGGIRNLELTVTNDSKYLLDNVTVELQYLKPSELPLRTETIQFRAISPGGAMTIRIPDTNRGIKVTYRIIHILSTQSAKELADL